MHPARAVERDLGLVFGGPALVSWLLFLFLRGYLLLNLLVILDKALQLIVKVLALQVKVKLNRK